MDGSRFRVGSRIATELGLVVGLAVGCASSTPPLGHRADAGTKIDSADAPSIAPLDSAVDEICDGRDDLSLASYLKPQFGRQIGAAVAIELGAGFLYVDGHCQYWVWKTGELEAFRTGVLSRTDLVELLRAWSFDRWATFSARWDGDGFDVPYHVFYSRKHGFACYGGCPNAPIEVSEAAAAAIDWRAILWERGQPMINAVMRVAPYREDGNNFPALFGQTPTQWPFSVSPQEMTLWRDSPDEPGTGYVVTNPAELAAIRHERDNARVRTDPGLYFGPYEGRYQVLSAREVLPLENEVGLIAEPDFIRAFWLNDF